MHFFPFVLLQLGMFYVVLHDELSAINPILKFSVIKCVVLFMWWQGVLVNVLESTSEMKQADDGLLKRGNFILFGLELLARLGKVHAHPLHLHACGVERCARHPQLGSCRARARHIRHHQPTTNPPTNKPTQLYRSRSSTTLTFGPQWICGATTPRPQLRRMVTFLRG